jgi:hypothetical protein
VHRVLLRSILVGFGLVGWMALNVSGALADEFTVAIVISPMGSEVLSDEFMEGFQLAVDQSPDVSHPPNTEGGDHLGSMDVAFVVIDDRLQRKSVQWPVSQSISARFRAEHRYCCDLDGEPDLVKRRLEDPEVFGWADATHRQVGMKGAILRFETSFHCSFFAVGCDKIENVVIVLNSEEEHGGFG